LQSRRKNSCACFRSVTNTFDDPLLSSGSQSSGRRRLQLDDKVHQRTKRLHRGDCPCTSNQGAGPIESTFTQNQPASGVPSPLDSFLVLRGSKDALHVRRMQRHAEKRGSIRRFSSKIRSGEGHYPGLGPIHPNTRCAPGKMKGLGDDEPSRSRRSEAARRPQSGQIFACAESLGGVESLIEHPGDHDARLGAKGNPTKARHLRRADSHSRS